MKVLEVDPLAEGDFYPGDLLVSVIRAESFLASSPNLLASLLDLANRAIAGLRDHDEAVRRELGDFMMRHRPPVPFSH